jgi:Na+-transporting methylmalonyl-CoA/oxaloacetate decarboxylase gamma subunit
MMNGIQQGLLITAIGMGLVFGVIIFLWGLMALMMRLTSKEKDSLKEGTANISSNEPINSEGRVVERQRQVIAAATVVSLLLKAEKLNQSLENRPKFDRLSPWQAVHRARQLEKRG